MNEIPFFEGKKNPFDIIRSFLFTIRFFRNNPDYFEPDGIWIFCGSQGSGKTLSAIQTVQKLSAQYPKAIVCSNLDIRGLSVPVIPFERYEQIEETKNGIHGVIFLIDEIHVLWNSLESKDISISEMACFAQMRKDRRIIIGTAQRFNRIAKPIREQLKYCILCRNVLKYIQINQVLDPNATGYNTESDGEIEGELLKTSIWFHSPKNYESYDTLKKIERIKRKKGRFST